MEIHIGKRIAQLELVSKEGNKVKLTIDGKEYDFDIVMTENGVCSILHNGKSFNAELIRQELGKRYKVNTHFSSFDVEVVDNQAKYLRTRKKEEEAQDNKISSPMPGKIVKILVKEGDYVKAGDNVLIIEAMKMQSNFKVSSDCTIKEVLVAEGDAVSGDQVLIKLDLEKE
ncbi:MAG: biotin/lipoyl-containing protein [Bacteroidales bacterium]|nr:biotin/lipoyl-containing protein [Bacteroidales bacterium]